MPEDPTLYSGTAGIAVSLWLRARRLQDEQLAVAAEIAFERALSEVATVPMGSSLYEGVLGPAWAWMLSHANELSVDFAELDSAILESFSSKWTGSFDYIAGLGGIATYALSVRKRVMSDAILSATLHHLGAIAESTHDGLAWRTTREFAPQRSPELNASPYIGLGFAHGQAGIVAILARVAKFRPELSPAIELLHGAARQLVTLVQRHEGKQGELPRWISCDRVGPIAESGWCHGSASIGYAIASAGQVLCNQEYLNVGLSLAERNLRLARREGGMRNICLCHGVAGMASIAWRLAVLSNADEFMRERKYWMDKLHDEERAGVHRDGRNTSFMLGAGGVELALGVEGGENEEALAVFLP
jgi:lantibiotic modifying enzyme